jgi:hypothetical protein
MTKNIKFNPVTELAALTVPAPKPAENYIPSWFKKMKPFNTESPQFNYDRGSVNVTAKKCMPFSDSFSMGYIQETWMDIWIEKEGDQFRFCYPADPKIMSARLLESTNSIFPKIDGFMPNQFTWHPPWWPELPPGYSCILTHPLNQDDLPFRTFTGILDTDSFTICAPASNIPFMLNENFSGMIKKGTPMYQIIPFKRENWESSIGNYDHKKQTTIVKRTKQYFWDGYKKLYWKKKQFK